MRVLLVEDEMAAAQMLAKGLREQAYAVDVSSEGNDASFRLSTTNYDAVILDVTLPGKDPTERPILSARSFKVYFLCLRRSWIRIASAEISSCMSI